jgi:hypothetical protein
MMLQVFLSMWIVVSSIFNLSLKSEVFEEALSSLSVFCQRQRQPPIHHPTL